MKHKHHIIPKHAGGSDDSNNLIELTIEEHAEAHRKLYEEHGRWQDRVAWLSLSGKIGHEERLFEIARNSNLGNPTGYKHSDYILKHLSEVKKGKNNPMYNKPAHNRGKNRPGVGGRKKGTVWSEDERKLQEELRSKPGYYDFTQDPERNKKISEAHKGKKGNATGKTWFTDGYTETYAFECPQGFRKGRKPRKHNGKKGMRWYNNGVVNKQFKEGTETAGFIHGRINKK